jgi:hypothetical protein
LGKLQRDQRVNFTNFEVVPGNLSLPFLPHLKPASAPNYGKVGAGKTGVFTYERSTIYGGAGSATRFRYGCAFPITGIPTSCVVTVRRTCYSFAIDDLETVTYSLPYNATNNLTMALTPDFPYAYECANDTLVAKSLIGLPVDLYIDEFIHAQWMKLAI